MRVKSHTTIKYKSWSILYWSNQNRIRWISFDHWKESTQVNESISNERFMYIHQLCWLTSKISSCMWQFFRSRERSSIFSKRIQTKHYVVFWILSKVHFEKETFLNESQLVYKLLQEKRFLCHSTCRLFMTKLRKKTIFHLWKVRYNFHRNRREVSTIETSTISQRCFDHDLQLSKTQNLEIFFKHQVF